MALLALCPSLILFLCTACSRDSTAWQDPASEATHAGTPKLSLQVLYEGFQSPTFLCSDPHDATRLFILEQAGRLRILENGLLLDHDLIDLREKTNTVSERGLLGMAFHPQFPQQPYLFLHYSDTDGSTLIARFDVDAESWIADPASEKLLLRVAQPWPNHNGGMIAFGPKDGFLYIGLGDGGAANDPKDASQDGHNLLGKILRLDVDRGEPYAIPASNPFINHDDFRDEIWAYGLRNPWRFCFDPLNGDLYIGDVGQNKWEELDWQSGASKGGENYGWRVIEGNHDFKKSNHPHDDKMVAPIHEYSHRGGHCSVTGGYVYRGESIPWLQGRYLYGDFCSGSVGTLLVQNGSVVERNNHTSELSQDNDLNTLVSFGVDANQEMYIVCMNGSVYKIAEAPSSSK